MGRPCGDDNLAKRVDAQSVAGKEARKSKIRKGVKEGKESVGNNIKDRRNWRLLIETIVRKSEDGEDKKWSEIETMINHISDVTDAKRGTILVSVEGTHTPCLPFDLSSVVPAVSATFPLHGTRVTFILTI